MPVYTYKAMNAKGKQVTGLVDADTLKAAKAKLRKDGKFPISLEETSEQKKIKGKGLAMEINFSGLRQKVNLQDLAIMTRQFAVLVGAGIPVVDSLTALSKQTESDALKRAISQVREKVNEGSSLAKALADHPKVFSPLYINMVESGEQSGTLHIVLDRLADFTENQLETKQRIRSAMMYPIFMGFVLTGAVGFMMVYMVPKMAELFKGMKKTLPPITTALISFSKFIQSYWWLILLLAVAGVWLFRRWVATDKGRTTWDSIILKLPYVGRLVQKIAVSRFSRTLGTMLSSGVPIITAMEIVKNVVTNEVIRKAVETSRDNIKEGESIARPLERSEVFPPMVIHMIEVGEKTGELESMLNRVSVAYDNEVEAAISGLVSLLEPAMILVMAGFVGFVVLAMVLPIMDMTSGLGH